MISNKEILSRLIHFNLKITKVTRNTNLICDLSLTDAPYKDLVFLRVSCRNQNDIINRTILIIIFTTASNITICETFCDKIIYLKREDLTFISSIEFC